MYTNSPEASSYSHYDTTMQNEQLEFHSFSTEDNVQPYDSYARTPYNSNVYNSQHPNYNNWSDDFNETEPPLLEELEIYPDRILEKTLAVLNPFRNQGLADDSEFLVKESDLVGPVAFSLSFASFLFLSGKGTSFGYIYGLCVITSVIMYALLTLMTVRTVFTLANVASVLGYCLLPIVGLSAFGVFVRMDGFGGLVLAAVAVIWSCISASRLFCAMTGNQEQRLLIGYPCGLVYCTFVLFVIF